MRRQRQWLIILMLSLGVLSNGGCLKWDFWRSDKSSVQSSAKSNLRTSSETLKKITSTPLTTAVAPTDRALASVMRLLEQADAVHREVWRVVAEQALAVTKTPFGKAQRALVSSQNKPLANKGLFLCDRYAVKRDIFKAGAFPQKFEVYESCQRNSTQSRPLALIEATSATDLKIVFTPSSLEEILGTGPAILNQAITCTLKGTATGALAQMNCQSWAQSKDTEQMISFESYRFEAEGATMIQLKGKIHENLREVRKLEVKIPAQGEILITETELHPPEPDPRQAGQSSPTPPPKPTPVLMKDGVPAGLTPQQEADLREINRKAEAERKANGGGRHSITPLPGSPGHEQKQKYIETEQGLVPVDEAGNPLPQNPETGEYYQPEGSAVSEPGDDNRMYPPEGRPEGGGTGQNLPSPDLPSNGNQQMDPDDGSDEIDEAPIPPPRGQSSGGDTHGR